MSPKHSTIFFPVLPQVGDAPSPAAPYSPVSRRRCGDGPGMLRAGIRDVHAHAGKSCRNRPQGLASRSANDPRHADAIVPDRRRRLPVHAGVTACRTRMNVPATGIIHAGPGSLMRTGGEGRTQGPGRHCGSCGRLMAPTGAIEKSNWTQGPACPPESAAHPLRMHPCRDTGNRAMNVPGTGNWEAERTLGGRKGRSTSEMCEIPVSCVAFRAARDRSAAARFAHDNFRYRA